MTVNKKGVRTQKTQANNLKRAVMRMRLSYPNISRVHQSQSVMDMAPKYRLEMGRRCQMHTTKIPANVRKTGVGMDKYRCKKLAFYHYESVNGGGTDVCATHIYDVLHKSPEDSKAMLDYEYKNQELFELISKEEGVVDSEGGSGDTAKP